jgi:peptidoglycan/LPS O-acetylase OafA/YrhL
MGVGATVITEGRVFGLKDGSHPVGGTVSHDLRLDIQGLRAIAVLMVVAFHAGLPVPGGFVGVGIFFVTSAFVITGMIHREGSSTGRFKFGRFYIRRFNRLTPTLVLMVAVTLVLSFYAENRDMRHPFRRTRLSTLLELRLR